MRERHSWCSFDGGSCLATVVLPFRAKLSCIVWSFFCSIGIWDNSYRESRHSDSEQGNHMPYGKHAHAHTDYQNTCYYCHGSSSCTGDNTHTYYPAPHQIWKLWSSLIVALSTHLVIKMIKYLYIISIYAATSGQHTATLNLTACQHIQCSL